jgi:predicted nucleic-acid-binding protein
MYAIDTNIVVRCLVDDDPDQCRRARALVSAEQIRLTTTVLLETDWVLRGVFGLARETRVAALRGFVGLPTVVVDNPSAALLALRWADQGMDFADALHLVGADNCEAFVTFDKRLAKAAAKIGAIKVREP